MLHPASCVCSNTCSQRASPSSVLRRTCPTRSSCSATTTRAAPTRSSCKGSRRVSYKFQIQCFELLSRSPSRFHSPLPARAAGRGSFLLRPSQGGAATTTADPAPATARVLHLYTLFVLCDQKVHKFRIESLADDSFRLAGIAYERSALHQNTSRLICNHFQSIYY